MEIASDVGNIKLSIVEIDPDVGNKELKVAEVEPDIVNNELNVFGMSLMSVTSDSMSSTMNRRSSTTK